MVDDDAQDLEDQVEQCQLNAQALLVGTAQVLAADPATVAQWERGIAAVFLMGWDTEREWNAADVLDALLQNFAAFGAAIDDVELESPRPTATITDVPRADLAELLGFPPGSGEVLLRIGALIASGLGATLRWERTGGDAFRLEVAATAAREDNVRNET